MSAAIAADVRVDNGPMVKGELTVERDVQYLRSYTATTPDLTWELVDKAGHFHAYSIQGGDVLPTLQTRRVHMECSAVHDNDLDECEGRDVVVYSCRICAEDVEPRRVPDPGPVTSPGRWRWSVMIRAYVPYGDSVSVRVMTGAGEYFGVALPTGGAVGPEGVTTHLIGNGPLGQRRRAPKCTCALVDTSTNAERPAFARSDPTGCKVHGQVRAARIEAAKRLARGDVEDPFYEASST